MKYLGQASSVSAIRLQLSAPLETCAPGTMWAGEKASCSLSLKKLAVF